MSTVVKILKAFHGDCILIHTIDKDGAPFNILIDGGPPQTFKTSLLNELRKIAKIDLLILTHIDDDHIGGLLRFLESDQAIKISISRLIVNAPNLLRINEGTQISYQQGEEFERFIFSKYPDIKIYKGVSLEKNFDLPLGIDLTILSPTKEVIEELYRQWSFIDFNSKDSTQISSTVVNGAKDFDLSLDELASLKDESKSIKSDIFNASSIAFILKTIDKNLLFLGDSHPELVVSSLESINLSESIKIFDYVKLAHHGSEYNISSDFFKNISSNNFIISTDGGKGRTKHPNRKTIAKIVCNPFRNTKPINFYFNYPLNEIQKKTGKLIRENEEQQFKFKFLEKNILE